MINIIFIVFISMRYKLNINESYSKKTALTPMRKIFNMGKFVHFYCIYFLTSNGIY